MQARARGWAELPSTKLVRALGHRDGVHEDLVAVVAEKRDRGALVHCHTAIAAAPSHEKFRLVAGSREPAASAIAIPTHTQHCPARPTPVVSASDLVCFVQLTGSLPGRRPVGF